MHNLDNPCTGVKGECACGSGEERGNEGGGGGNVHAREIRRRGEREEEGRLRG